MHSRSHALVLDPSRVWSLELPRLDGALRRLTLRALLSLSGGAVRVEGGERLAAAPEPSIFALSHHNAWEAILAPPALMAMRRGRTVRFLADWMFVDLPWTGWLLRSARPIPVYAKRARFGLREGHRRRQQASATPVERALGEVARLSRKLYLQSARADRGTALAAAPSPTQSATDGAAIAVAP